MVPTFPTATGRFIWDLLPKQYPPFFIFLSTPVICFSYFASLDVLFSIWFFDFVYMIEAGALNRIGIVATSPHYGAGPYTETTYKWQTAGAFVTLVLWWLWISRGHLREVFRKAFQPGPLLGGRRPGTAFLPGGGDRPDCQLCVHCGLAWAGGGGSQDGRAVDSDHVYCLSVRGKGCGRFGDYLYSAACLGLGAFPGSAGGDGSSERLFARDVSVCCRSRWPSEEFYSAADRPDQSSGRFCREGQAPAFLGGLGGRLLWGW